MGYFMSDKNYQVIFLGQILNGFDENDVRNNLEPIFSGQVEHLFNNAPIHIKQNISLDQAQDITNKLERLGAKCEIASFQEDEITLTLESDEMPLSLEPSDQPDENKMENFNDNPPPEQSHVSPRMICPSCGFEQAESKECTNCAIIIDRYQENPEKPKTDAIPKKDVLQEYLEEMSKMPTPEEETETSGSLWFLKLITTFVFLALFSILGWSYYFFVCKKPWRATDIPTVSIQEFDDQAIDEDLVRLQSKKETILALQKAMERKERLQSTKKFSQSDDQFQLKNIPVPLLRHYIGKYVWVTCDNDSVHQGTLFAIYTEQIILKKPRFNLTIPINLSMILTV